MPSPSLPDLSGSVAVVTGAGGWIGAGIARRFAAAGAAVVARYRAASPLASWITGQNLVVDGGTSTGPTW